MTKHSGYHKEAATVVDNDQRIIKKIGGYAFVNHLLKTEHPPAFLKEMGDIHGAIDHPMSKHLQRCYHAVSNFKDHPRQEAIKQQQSQQLAQHLVDNHAIFGKGYAEGGAVEPVQTPASRAGMPYGGAQGAVPQVHIQGGSGGQRTGQMRFPHPSGQGYQTFTHNQRYRDSDD